MFFTFFKMHKCYRIAQSITYTLWWWQLECKDWTHESITTFGLEVNTKSIQEDESFSIWVESWISCFNPNWGSILSIINPCYAVLIWLYRVLISASKSPKRRISSGLLAVTESRFNSRLSTKDSKISLE